MSDYHDPEISFYDPEGHYHIIRRKGRVVLPGARWFMRQSAKSEIKQQPKPVNQKGSNDPLP